MAVVMIVIGMRIRVPLMMVGKIMVAVVVICTIVLMRLFCMLPFGDFCRVNRRCGRCRLLH